MSDDRFVEGVYDKPPKEEKKQEEKCTLFEPDTRKQGYWEVRSIKEADKILKLKKANFPSLDSAVQEFVERKLGEFCELTWLHSKYGGVTYAYRAGKIKGTVNVVTAPVLLTSDTRVIVSSVKKDGH